MYVRGGNERVQTRLRQAEEEAFFICEGCGGPSLGIGDRDGYLTTLCDPCAISAKNRSA